MHTNTAIHTERGKSTTATVLNHIPHTFYGKEYSGEGCIYSTDSEATSMITWLIFIADARLIYYPRVPTLPANDLRWLVGERRSMKIESSARDTTLGGRGRLRTT
jgi:hypothetical protein